MQMDLRNSILTLITSKVVDLAITLGILAILTNNVSPMFFGFYAFILAITAILNPFLDLGLTETYISKDEDASEVTNLYFTLNIIAGLILALVTALVGLAIAYLQDHIIVFFYALSQSASYILLSISRQANATLLKNCEFGKIALVSVASSVVTVVVLCIGLLFDFPEFILIPVRFLTPIVMQFFLILYFSEKFFFTISLRNISDYRTKLVFGGWVLSNRIVSGLFNSLERFFILLLFPISSAGQLSTGIQLYRMVDIYFRMPLSSVYYSFISRQKFNNLAKQETRMVADYLRVCWYSIAGLCFIGVILLPFVNPYLFSDEWTTLTQVLPYLIFAGIPISTFGILTVANLILDNQKRQFKFNFIALIFLIGLYLLAVILRFDAVEYAKTFVSSMLFLSSLALLQVLLETKNATKMILAYFSLLNIIVFGYIWSEFIPIFWISLGLIIIFLALFNDLMRFFNGRYYSHRRL